VHAPHTEAELRDAGFTIVGPVLDADDCAELTGVFDRMMTTLGGPPADGWFTTGMITDRAVRRGVYDAVGERLRLRLATVCPTGPDTFLAGNFHHNPPSTAGGLWPHQDVAVVDETGFVTYNGWIPLVDSDLDNGTLRFVPGSHRFGNLDRSLALPWAFEGLDDIFREFAVPVQVPAGHLVLFDTAIVHCSTPNRTPTRRLAVNCILKPAGAPIRHLVPAPTEAGSVDVYHVDERFLVEGDITGVPGPDEGTRVGTRPLHTTATAPDEIRRRCAAAVA